MEDPQQEIRHFKELLEMKRKELENKQKEIQQLEQIIANMENQQGQGQ